MPDNRSLKLGLKAGIRPQVQEEMIGKAVIFIISTVDEEERHGVWPLITVPCGHHEAVVSLLEVATQLRICPVNRIVPRLAL